MHIGDQVDLAWVTGGEDDNKGYIVEKRPSYGGDFQEVYEYMYLSYIYENSHKFMYVYRFRNT
jgi:hypothetical protein